MLSHHTSMARVLYPTAVVAVVVLSTVTACFRTLRRDDEVDQPLAVHREGLDRLAEL